MRRDNYNIGESLGGNSPKSQLPLTSHLLFSNQPQILHSRPRWNSNSHLRVLTNLSLIVPPIQQQHPFRLHILKPADMRPIFSALQKTAARTWTQPIRTVRTPQVPSKLNFNNAKCRTQQFRNISQSRSLANGLNVVDHPARLVRVNKKHGPGLIILGTCMFDWRVLSGEKI